MSPQNPLAESLLTWYRANCRDLPWRRTRDAYCILLSEFMLQQTQVDTVIPYYHRFLNRFPTVRHLARAAQDDVLKAWEGLGYYARARNLHKAAQAIVAHFNGRVPDAPDALRSLPGFGPYTTAAVASIAFDRDCAVLDGNVIRVLTRLFDIRDNIAQTRVKHQLQELAQSLLPPGQAGDYNQAIMDLGALVCTPTNPACPTCPVAAHCRAYQSGDPKTLPVKAAKKPRPHRILGVAIVRKGKRYLITQRPENGLLGGLWEFPAGVQQSGESLQNTCIRGVREAVGIDITPRTRFRTVNHAFTHFSVAMHAFLCTHEKGAARPIGCADCAWVSPQAFDTYAFSRANRKLVDFLLRDQTDMFSK